MAILRSIPRSRKMPSLRNVVMIDTIRGVLRVRRWPKKYGKARSPLQQYWIDWFTQANRLAKYADGMAQARAIEMTKGSGLYPRDVMVAAMRGRLYSWVDQTGWKWYPVAAIQDISNSLDVLAQTVGSVLVRAADRWRAAGPAVPVVGQALTFQGAGLPPLWQTPGAGVSQQLLPGSPITVDNSVNEYVFDVTGYAEIDFVIHNLIYAASDRTLVRFSTDDGVSYHSGASDYSFIWLASGAEAQGHYGYFIFARKPGTQEHNAFAHATGLRAGNPLFLADVAYDTTDAARISSYAHFPGPITHIKLYTESGNNYKTGQIQAVGLVAA